VVLDTNSNQPLSARDVAVFASQPSRARVAELRQYGVRAVVADWPAALAHTVESLIALHADLGADGRDELLTGVDACGPGQTRWDPDHAMLVDAEEPAVDARRAAVAYLASIVRGSRRL
jgi:hypothetical protein